jgi:hypothetical protein
VEEDFGFHFFGMNFHWIGGYEIFFIGSTLGIFYREVGGPELARCNVMMTASSPLSL